MKAFQNLPFFDPSNYEISGPATAKAKRWLMPRPEIFAAGNWNLCGGPNGSAGKPISHGEILRYLALNPLTNKHRLERVTLSPGVFHLVCKIRQSGGMWLERMDASFTRGITDPEDSELLFTNPHQEETTMGKSKGKGKPGGKKC